MTSWLREVFEGRPWWMNVLMVFCAYMAFVYLPWDFFVKPVATDAEVWFGVRLTGGWAKAAEPAHWAIYAAGYLGFRRMRSWMWPWAAAYAAQVAIGMLIWNWLYVDGVFGFLFGVISFLPFAALTLALWNAADIFDEERTSLRDRYGEWAVITGASAGIGAEFARALARQGISCVLTARREDRLRELASELEKNYQVSTRIVPVDLADSAGAERLIEAVEDLEVAMLVNNAGFGYAGRFDKLERKRLREMITLNCTAPVVLTHALLPGMCERGRGAVIVTGSAAGRQPLPLHGVYSATKSFDLLFGESLAVELKDQGIDVLVIEPGSTETEFQRVAGEIAHSGESAEAVVALALRELGRQPSVMSGWLNWMRANAATRLLPRSLVAHIARDVIAAQTPEEMR